MGTGEILDTIMTENFSQINVRHQTIDLGSSENTNQVNTKKTTPQHIIFKLQKIKDFKNTERSQREKNKQKNKAKIPLYL